MIIIATQKNTRQTARKVRLVANSVKKLPLMDAVKQLASIEKRSTLVILKVLRQAIANAVHNHGFSIDDLTIKSITVAPAPQLKRFRAVSRGRAHTIIKRACHITVELEASEEKKATVVSKDSKKLKAEVVDKKTKTSTKEIGKPGLKKVSIEKVNRKVVSTQKTVTKISNTKQKKGQAK